MLNGHSGNHLALQPPIFKHIFLRGANTVTRVATSPEECAWIRFGGYRGEVHSRMSVPVALYPFRPGPSHGHRCQQTQWVQILDVGVGGAMAYVLLGQRYAGWQSSSTPPQPADRH